MEKTGAKCIPKTKAFKQIAEMFDVSGISLPTGYYHLGYKVSTNRLFCFLAGVIEHQIWKIVYQKTGKK